MKGLQVLVLAALLVISTIGISGEGPVWMKYVGCGMIYVLLMLILTQVSNIPSTTDLKKMLLGAEAAATARAEQTTTEDDDMADSTRGRRSARN